MKLMCKHRCISKQNKFPCTCCFVVDQYTNSMKLTLLLSRQPSPNGLDSKLTFLVGISCMGSWWTLAVDESQCTDLQSTWFERENQSQDFPYKLSKQIIAQKKKHVLADTHWVLIDTGRVFWYCTSIKPFVVLLPKRYSLVLLSHVFSNVTWTYKPKVAINLPPRNYMYLYMIL